MVTIRVGTDPATEFTVHHEVLQGSESKFFQVAFDNGFKETLTGILEMPEDDPAAVQVLLRWLYSTFYHWSHCPREEVFSEESSEVMLKVYVMACKYAMDVLQDAVVTHFWSYARTCSWMGLEIKADAWVYFGANTMQNCKLAKLFSDWVIDSTLKDPSKMNTESFNRLNDLPKPLLVVSFLKLDSARHLLAQGRIASINKQIGTLCSYHLHEAKKPCHAIAYPSDNRGEL